MQTLTQVCNQAPAQAPAQGLPPTVQIASEAPGRGIPTNTTQNLVAGQDPIIGLPREVKPADQQW